MVVLIVRRLLQSLIVMLAVGLIAFLLFRYAGDPVTQMVGPDATFQERDWWREKLALDDTVLVQFGGFVARAVRGEFGYSFQNRLPVMQLIAARLPATLELSFASILLAVLFGIPLGVYTAIRRGRWTSNTIMALSLLGISMPAFLIGILLIYVFGVQLGWLPTFGRGEVVSIGWWSTGLLSLSGLKALILPAITLAVFQLALIMRLVRTEMLEVLRSDFIKFARARGLTDRSVNFSHGLRNTLVPVVTVVGLQAGSVLAFSIITETVFQWPGLGLLFLQAIQSVDIPIMSAYLVLIALMFVSINLVVDILYFTIDPRLSAVR